MQHSIIIRLCKRIIGCIKQYYKFSTTRRMINNTLNTLKRFFVNSAIYKFFSSENYDIKKLLGYSIIGKFENALQKILELLNPLYRKGVQGSFIMKKADETKMWKKGNSKNINVLISFIVIGALLSYNLLGLIDHTIYIEQMYISVIIIFLTINLYFIDIANLYKNSYIKKIVDSIFHI